MNNKVIHFKVKCKKYKAKCKKGFFMKSNKK